MCDVSFSGLGSGNGGKDQAAKNQGCYPESCPGMPLSESGKVWAGTATVRTTGDIEAVLDVVLDALKRNGFSRQEIFGIHLSLTEAIVNGVKHGHQGNPSKQVRIRYLINYVGLLAQIEDEGPGFVRSRVIDPRAPENLDKPTGRGLLLMHYYMTEVRYNGAGNCVTLIKRRGTGAG